MSTLNTLGLRLRKDLTTHQRITAISLIVFGILASILCVVVIFALADLGRPSFLPWVALLLFGVGPFVTAFEEYGTSNDEGDTKAETATPARDLHRRPTPPRLRLIRSPEFDTDQPYDQEKDQGHHVRPAI